MMKAKCFVPSDDALRNRMEQLWSLYSDMTFMSLQIPSMLWTALYHWYISLTTDRKQALILWDEGMRFCMVYSYLLLSDRFPQKLGENNNKLLFFSQFLWVRSLGVA